MGLSYNKLWKLMIDKNINKTELHILTGLSQSTINKLKKCENVNVNVLERICRKLNCQIGDIVELSEGYENGQK
jgi:DNA-binding Xre family transcriptional regulator